MDVQDKFGSACGLGRLISMVSHQMKRQRRLPETESGLTNMQRLILHYILFQSLERDIYQKDIEREFKIRRSSATGILQLLEKHGFIRRETAQWDARFKKLVPTEKATRLREQILSNIQYMEALLRKGISPEDLETCRHVLEQMSVNLSGNEKSKKKEKNET